MAVGRKADLDRRLDAYLATVRLRTRPANWQIYAAVTGSAMAMATGASAALIAIDPAAGGGTASVRPQPAMQSAAAPSVANPIAAPFITPAGIVPLYGTVNTIQPGEWITIYGTNLAATTATWDGTFATSLGGTSVEINGRPAYLMYVSPTQINLQAPDDTATGTVPVMVTTAGGVATSTVTLSPVSPSFSLLASKHVAGIILRPPGKSGPNYYVLGPTGKSFGYQTVAANVGDTVALFGVGFGPTTPAVPAGQPYSGAAPINDTFSLYINNVIVKPSFVGISSAGLYQINLVVPAGVGEGDVPIEAVVNGVQTQAGVLFSLRRSSGSGTNQGTGGGTGTAGPPFSFGPGTWGTGGTGGTGGGGGGTGGGGSGGGGSVRRPKKHYTPKLQYPPGEASK